MKKLKDLLLTVIVAVILFLIISMAYMYPALQGKKVSQHDITQHIGMSKEIVDFRNETSKEALWTNSIFGGMPAYLISTKYNSNLLRVFHYALNLNNWRPISFIFLYLIGFYIALLGFGVDRWLSIAGAIAYAFSSYFFIIIVAGHNSKALALGYMPVIIAGVYLAFKGKYLLGGLLLGLFLSLQIFITHLQITYYTLLIVLLYGIVEFIFVIKEKRYKTFFLAIASLSVAAILAIGSNFASIWTTYEYGNYSMRGKPELTKDKEVQTSGLDKDYATDWSYGISETFTLLIPNFKGGASISAIPEKSKTYEFIKKIQGAKDARKTIKQMPTYWGDQPGTSGPVYVGAILIFLFVFGLFIVKGKIKWWLLIVTILSIVLAWGRNFPLLTNFFLDYFPGYNKFRTVTMTLIMAEFAIPLLGILSVNEMLKGNLQKKVLVKALLNSFYITGGLCLFFIVAAGALFNFSSPIDQQYLAQGATDFVNALQDDRLMLLRRDAFRSLVFIALGGGIVYLYLNEKISRQYFIAGLGMLILIDMWPIDKRYLNADNFVTNREYKNPIPKSKADEFILTHASSDPDYRVLNLAVSPFQDATTSYWHKSIGGYHGAKMRRYQDLIESYISPEIQSLINALRSGNMRTADTVLKQSKVLNMLNTRYIIYNPDAMPIINTFNYGHAWFVERLEFAADPDEEIYLLGLSNPRKFAVVNRKFGDFFTSFKFDIDTSASIKLTSYAPNKLVYKSSSSVDQLAVFSEIYYPKGWMVEIDGEKTDYFNANYILRAMLVPAGDHEIVFTFRPKSFYTGNKISRASSLLLLILLLGVAVVEIRKYLQNAQMTKN